MKQNTTDIEVRRSPLVPQRLINAMCLTYVALAFVTGSFIGIFIFVIYALFLGLLFFKRG